jgi:hypothetical protein
MPKKLSAGNLMTKVGAYAFIVVLIVAVVAGLAVSKLDLNQLAWVSLALAILGIVIGLTMITEKEVTAFLIVAVALIVTNGVGAFANLNQIWGGLGTAIQQVVTNIATFVAPAAVILSVKSIYALARTK